MGAECSDRKPDAWGGDQPEDYDGRWPILLRKIDRILAQWQIDVEIENPTIENRIGQSEPLRVRLRNPEPNAATGVLEVIAPSLLQDEKIER